MKKIGILTSGGDSPGMNPAIRAVVRTAISAGKEVVGIMGGYQGILDQRFKPLLWHDVGSIIQRGGTIIGTGRYPAFWEKAIRKKAVDILKSNGIEGLVVIGGDGSFTGALALWEDFQFPVVGIPGTIDNDIWGTDFSLGTDTALNLGVEALDRLRDTAEAHKRVFVVEMFGNQSGYLVTLCGLAAGAVHILVPERPVGAQDLDALAEKISSWYSKAVNQANWDEMPRNAIIVIAEGAKLAHLPTERLDNKLNKIRDVQYRLEKKLRPVGGDCRITVLGHTQRGGSPSAFERILGTRLGAEAVKVLEKEKEAYMVGIKGNKLEKTPLKDVIRETRRLQEYPHENQVLKELIALQDTLSETNPPLPKKPGSKKLLILTSGADAPGMNMGIRAVARLARRKGWQSFGVRHGFSSLLSGKAETFRELDWEDVHMGKMVLEGSFLGNERRKDIKEEDVQQIWKAVHDQEIDALVVFGGIHSFEACHKLSQAPGYKPIMFLPATISNNIPGTDMCIGADTGLNNLVTVLDKSRDTGTALQRVLVVETMGRNCGWLAIHAALAGGAEAVFDKETGVSLGQLEQVTTYLKKAFNRPGKAAQKSAVIILNERAGELFSARTIADILAQETGHEARVVNPGQMQRGGPPSAFDRVLSCYLAGRAVEELERAFEAGDKGAFVIGWNDGKVSARRLDGLVQEFAPDGEGILYNRAKEDHELLRRLSERPDEG
ncbi:MAG: ATP-dependent 6-phosphofructokinase [Lewinellaceae bacterium]|nr:ATP-dependent 6-phosphofructokinase [Lewinellaceae bacterium]